MRTVSSPCRSISPSGSSRHNGISPQYVMTTIHARSTAQIEKEKQENYILHLTHANLKHVFLNGANLSEANLTETNLNDAWLQEANLSDALLFGVHLVSANLRCANLAGAKALGANLLNANLAGANLTGAYLADASLKSTDLTGADLRNCKGITQDQIDQAAAREDIPPKLEGAVDTNTGEPLVWRGRVLIPSCAKTRHF